MKNYDEWKCTTPDCDSPEVDDEEPEPKEYRCIVCDTRVGCDEDCPRCEAAEDRATEWDACDDHDMREAAGWD